MKNKCHRCMKLKITTRFGYRWVDFTRRYKYSGRKQIHTRNFDVCRKCLKIIREKI